MTSPLEEGLRLLSEYDDDYSTRADYDNLVDFVFKNRHLLFIDLPARVAELEDGLRPFKESYEREKWLVKHHVHPTEDAMTKVDFAASKVRVDFADCARAASLLGGVGEEGESGK